MLYVKLNRNIGKWCISTKVKDTDSYFECDYNGKTADAEFCPENYPDLCFYPLEDNDDTELAFIGEVQVIEGRKYGKIWWKKASA